MIWNKTLIRGTSSAPHGVSLLSREHDIDVEHRMTAGIATEDGCRVALAITALALGAVAMGASVLFVRCADGVLILYGIRIARPRTGQLEVGP